jgi:hypothetical protein
MLLLLLLMLSICRVAVLLALQKASFAAVMTRIT